MLALFLGIQANAQITNRLIVTQNFEQGINAPNLMFTVPPNDNRIYVASRDSLKLNISQIRKWQDSVYAFSSTLFKAIGYVPDWSEITGKPTTLVGYGITDAYPLSGNPSGFLTSYTETDPLFDTKLATKTTSNLTEGTNLYYTNTRARNALSAGTGIGYNASTGVITNSAPDQTVSLTGSNGITTSGTYPNFTIATTKRQETYSGTTNGSGAYTVTFGTAYGVAPNIQANIIGGSNTNLIKITSISTTGFTVNVVNRVDVIGLLPTYSNVSGAVVDTLITEK